MARIHVTVEEGSDITYRLTFGDEHHTLDEPYLFKENISRKLSTDPDFNVLSHYYRYCDIYS